jgi:glucose-1-phosphate cytidylyltransferase
LVRRRLTRDRGLLHYLWQYGRRRRNLSPRVFSYIKGDATVWRNVALEWLEREGKVTAYRHDGLWQPMDTRQGMRPPEGPGHKGTAPWHVN